MAEIAKKYEKGPFVKEAMNKSETREVRIREYSDDVKRRTMQFWNKKTSNMNIYENIRLATEEDSKNIQSQIDVLSSPIPTYRLIQTQPISRMLYIYIMYIQFIYIYRDEPNASKECKIYKI